MSRQKSLFQTILVLLIAQNAHALNLQGYRFTDSYRYSLLDDSLHEKFDGRYVITASYGYIHSPFFYSDTYLHDKRKKIIDSNNILTTGFTYYLNKNVTVGLDLNAIHNTSFNETKTSLADSVVKSKINLRRSETFSFSLNPQVFIPTGQTENFSTMNSVGGALSAVVEKTFNKLHFLASLGALSAKNNQYADVDHRQLLLSQLGASYDVSESLNLNLEAYRNFPMVNDTLQDDGKYFLTAKHKTGKRFSTYFGAGVTALGEVQRESFSGFVGLKFSEDVPAAAPAVAAMPQQRQVQRFDDLYFGHNQAKLPKAQLENLEAVVEDLQGLKFTIEGYASSPGSIPYNLKLSEKRANFVRDYFLTKGIPENSMSVAPFGETFEQDPVEAKNRKVSIKIMNEDVAYEK